MTEYNRQVINAAIEVKKQIIDVLQFRVRYAISPADEMNNMHDRAKDAAIRELSRSLEKFIKAEIQGEYGERFIETSIYMPYVADEKMRNLQDNIHALEANTARLKRMIREHNTLPWWKRIWRPCGL